ncbi:MAG: dTMP kinase [Spirochaetales bacterium]|nr:dTMP kinase [Spirochaetales bacterium]
MHQVLKNFIVLEGLDGAGTSTQLSALGEILKTKSREYHLSCEPSDGPIGKLIRQILKGAITVHSDTLAYLFSADRKEHLYAPEKGVLAQLNNNKMAISDRYFYSSLAYQSIKSDFDFVYELNKDFPLPEHLFFLDISPEIGEKRLSSRDEKEIFEIPEIQIKVRDNYYRCFERLKNAGGSIHILDGTAAIEEITLKIRNILGL